MPEVDSGEARIDLLVRTLEGQADERANHSHEIENNDALTPLNKNLLD